MRSGIFAIPMLSLLAFGAAAHAETVTIAIGHQSMCTDTYTGGIVIKELGLLEKNLPANGKDNYRVTWSDYASGAPITNEMLAGKLNIGVMGDYPLIVNGAKFQATDSLRTLYVAGTGYNLKGSGNAIVVPVKSQAFSIKDLDGKSVSTPVGSAAWGMLIKAMQDANMQPSNVSLRNQAPPVGAANITAGKIDAHADFCPWPEIMEFRGTGRKIYDGSETGVPYLHGVVVRKEFAESHPEVVVAFIKAIYQAGQWIDADPVRAVEMMEKWTGVEKEVLYIYFSHGGHLTLDPTIKPRWADTLRFDHSVLAKANLSPPLDFDQWVTDRYVRQAFSELGLDYEALRAKIVDPETANRDRPVEIWHARDGILTYPTLRAFLQAVAAFQGTGAKLNATYVYDNETGLKLFGNTAFYVARADGEFAAFLRRDEAERYAASTGGKVITFSEALATASS